MFYSFPRIVFIQIATFYIINIDPRLFAEYRIKSSLKKREKVLALFSEKE